MNGRRIVCKVDGRHGTLSDYATVYFDDGKIDTIHWMFYHSETEADLTGGPANGTISDYIHAHEAELEEEVVELEKEVSGLHQELLETKKALQDALRVLVITNLR